jgi:hypothetical protein
MRVDGALTDHERHAIAGAHQLGLLRSSQWPDLAAHLLVQGVEGEAVAELAGVSRTASPSAVDHLVTKVLSEVGIPELASRQASDVIARLFGQIAAVQPTVDDFAAVRALARLAPGLDYPEVLVSDAYHAAEWLDCECHVDSHERHSAAALETRLRTSDPLVIDAELLAAMSVHWL